MRANGFTIPIIALGWFFLGFILAKYSWNKNENLFVARCILNLPPETWDKKEICKARYQLKEEE